jgi:hypothetical protein
VIDGNFGKPSEDQQAWTLDIAILARHSERLPAHADSAHHPLAAGAQVGFHVRDLKSPPLRHHFRRSSGFVNASKIRSTEALIVIS